ncbi:iron-containing alcohol dehydrogenase [Pseudonocardia xishanensis]|uniref:Fe-containing alcohol dehydrogenase-like C-terminal domain-containing protein n=1 Tax=Pseudonocardia xishanensis TaxID=630995 RepID=A0ABP8S0X1_9PSEU
MTLPAGLTVASGLNAMAHRVEAFWAPRRNPVSSAVAEDGIRRLAGGLPAVAADATDPAASADLLLGAHLAGSAFAVAGSGPHHEICHVLGGAFDLPHARTHAVVLPHVLAHNAPPPPRPSPGSRGHSARPTPRRRCTPWAGGLGLPAGLRELGPAEEDVDTVLDPILAVVPADNPRPVPREGLRGLLRRAWSGEAPRKETA